MLAAALLAASALAPAGVTATIQADPVCLNVTAQPGHSYPLTVYVSGSGPLSLAVTPAHGSLERSLHQVPASWARFASDPASPGMAGFTLAVPPDAEPGAYWSDVVATAGSQPGTGAQAVLGAAATTAIVLTVGPSSVPPPPCDALDLAQSTGKRPAWPTAAFRTTGWKQVFAEEQQDEPMPYTSPTAGTGTVSAPAGQYAPASPAASQGSAAGGMRLIGWGLVLAVIAFALSRIFGRKK